MNRHTLRGIAVLIAFGYPVLMWLRGEPAFTMDTIFYWFVAVFIFWSAKFKKD